jgi:hypothetical protein
LAREEARVRGCGRRLFAPAAASAVKRRIRRCQRRRGAAHAAALELAQARAHQLLRGGAVDARRKGELPRLLLLQRRAQRGALARCLAARAHKALRYVAARRRRAARRRAAAGARRQPRRVGVNARLEGALRRLARGLRCEAQAVQRLRLRARHLLAAQMQRRVTPRAAWRNVRALARPPLREQR